MPSTRPISGLNALDGFEYTMNPGNGGLVPDQRPVIAWRVVWGLSARLRVGRTVKHLPPEFFWRWDIAGVFTNLASERYVFGA